MVHVVTSASRYIDIDAYASILVYAELLTKQGLVVCAYNKATLNESITQTIKAWKPVVQFTTTAPPKQARYTLIDVSDPEQFSDVVVMDQTYEVIDHHPGFENFWAQRIGSQSHIEPVGSVATLI